MPQSRQLAAIMFTDIVGYTALMGDDEQKAFELLRRNRQIQQPLIERFGGKWIKELGDGILASFSTVTDAVLCACTIQQSCNKIADLKLRIGIHLGDVVFENNDVFGDGVNIASRLQALAPIGGIWVSDSVHKNIANKKGINSKFVREETLKHVKDPVRIYEVDIESFKAVTSEKSFKKISDLLLCQVENWLCSKALYEKTFRPKESEIISITKESGQHWDERRELKFNLFEA